MNPLDRLLRLRKSTVLNLDPSSASTVRGGKILVDTNSEWPICEDTTEGCSHHCSEACPTHWECTDDGTPSCTTEPHVGCCRY